MYTFKTHIKETEYNKFLYDNNASFMQEIAWAKVKNNWDYVTCGIYENKKLVASALLLIRKIVKGVTMIYIPRGYVIDFDNKELLQFMTDNIKKLAKKYNAYVVKIDPNFCRSEYYLKDENDKLEYYSKNFKKKHDNLLFLGYKHTGFSKDMHHNFQPRFNMAISLVDNNKNKISYNDLVARLKSKVRYYIGSYHEKRGVYYSYSFEKKDIKEFVKVLEETEKNKNIHLRSEEYFNKMMDNFPNRVCLLFGKVDLRKYLNFLESNNSKKEKIDQVKELIRIDGDEITLSSALLLLPNTKDQRTSEYLYAGNDLRLSELNVSSEIAMKAAEISIQNDCNYCNLGGVDGSLNDELSTFKQKYNAVLLEFAGEYDLVIKPATYFFINKFKPCLTKIYKLIKRKK